MNKTITFKSKQDLRTRLPRLWQDQKEGDEYDFVFLSKDAEEEFEKIVHAFQNPVV